MRRAFVLLAGMLIPVVGQAQAKPKPAPDQGSTPQAVETQADTEETRGFRIFETPLTPNESYNRHLVKGFTFFEVGQYEKAIAEWTRAYFVGRRQYKHPLYNMGSAHLRIAVRSWDRKRQLTEFQQAFDAYQIFLAETARLPLRSRFNRERADAVKNLRLVEPEIDRLEAALRQEEKDERQRVIQVCQTCSCGPVTATTYSR